MAEKPKEFFDIQGRQDYLTAREREILARAGRSAPAGEVVGVFGKTLLAQLATILLMMVILAVMGRFQDGDAGWQSAFLGPTLILLVPLAGTVWTLKEVGGHDFSSFPGRSTMKLCVAAMAVVFIAFIWGGIWVLSVLDPVTYHPLTVSTLMWSAVAVPTMIIGLALLVLLTWRLPLWLNLTLSLTMLVIMIFVGLLPVLHIGGALWTVPLLFVLRFVGPVLLIVGILAMPTERALLAAENDPVDDLNVISDTG